MFNHPSRFACAALLCALLAFAGCGVSPPAATPIPAQSSTPTSGNSVASTSSLGPDALAQLMLERINRARLRPTQEAARFSIDLNEGVSEKLNANPRQPVSFNGTLALAARQHADDMLANNYFAHNDLAGRTPFDRIRAAGYSHSAAGENLAWRGNTAAIDPVQTVELMHQDLFVDVGIADRGHRKVMLDDAFREVGVSIRRGPFTQDGTSYDSIMAVQEYATASAARTWFVLGVVYDDRNSNNQYDAAEGSANQRVALGNQSATTGDGGGFTFEVSPGNYTLRFSTGASQKLTLLDNNIKIDLVSGTQVVVNLGVGGF